MLNNDESRLKLYEGDHDKGKREKKEYTQGVYQVR